MCTNSLLFLSFIITRLFMYERMDRYIVIANYFFVTLDDLEMLINEKH